MTDPFAFFVGRGWKPHQAAGIVGNLGIESRLKPGAVGDGGAAYGAAQWHPDRQANFQRVMGVPIRGSSLDQQLSFVDWELNNTERNAGNKLRGTSTVADATYAVTRYYERPANMSSLGARTNMASKVLNGVAGLVTGNNRDTLKSLLGDKAGNAASDVLQHAGQALEAYANPFAGVTDGLGLTGECDWLCQFKTWISESGFFQRLALAIFALIFIAAALMLLKPVREGVVTAAKVATV